MGTYVQYDSLEPSNRLLTVPQAAAIKCGPFAILMQSIVGSTRVPNHLAAFQFALLSQCRSALDAAPSLAVNNRRRSCKYWYPSYLLPRCANQSKQLIAESLFLVQSLIFSSTAKFSGGSIMLVIFFSIESHYLHWP